MTNYSKSRTLKIVFSAAFFLFISTLGLMTLYRSLLFGPKLKPTPKELSLSKDIPPASDWDQTKLQAAMDYMDAKGSTSTIILQNGELVAEWGATNLVSSVHSVRKSIVSALYGIAVSKGLIDINQTLEELGIDDQHPSLSQQEKQARLEDLLTSSSGIYHPSVKDDNGRYPTPGSHSPGTHFFYNNWSFNAAGIIFEQLTNMRLGEAFQKWIAIPTNMEDFKIGDVRYTFGKESVFPAYRFWMSGRDLARFALLYTQKGKWKDQQIIPSDWIDKSLIQRSEGESSIAYGYMWWTMPSGVHLATGTGGQKIWIDPKHNLVLINRVNTGQGFSRAIWHIAGVRINNTHLRKLSDLVLDAKPLMIL